MEYHPFNVEIPKIPPFDRHPEQRPNMVARSGLMIVEGKGNHPKRNVYISDLGLIGLSLRRIVVGLKVYSKRIN